MYMRGLSIPTPKHLFSPQYLSCVLLSFAITHFVSDMETTVHHMWRWNRQSSLVSSPTNLNVENYHVHSSRTNFFGVPRTIHTSNPWRSKVLNVGLVDTTSTSVDEVSKALLQWNIGRIDRNMSKSRCPKLQNTVRKLSKMTERWLKMSELSLICPKWQKSVNFLSNFCSLGHLDSDMFCQFDHCFLVVSFSFHNRDYGF